MARVTCTFVILAAWLMGSLLNAQTVTDFTTGVKLYQDGEYQAAAKALEAATTANPKLEAGWHYLGLSRLKLKQFEPALDAFQKAVDLAPGRPGTRLYVGQVYETQGAYPQAIGVYQEELRYRRGKDVLPVQAALGRAQYLAGRHDQAVQQLQRVVLDNARYVDALYYLGLSEMELKRFDAALKHLLQAREVLDEWRGLVRRLARLKQLQEAGAASPTQQREVGRVQEQLAQDFGWAQQFGSEQGLWPTLNKAIGRVYLAKSEFANARNIYRKALDLEELGDPSDPEAFTLVGLAFLADAQDVFVRDGLLFQAIDTLNEAIKTIKTAQEKNKAYAPAHNALGEIYMFQAKTYVTKPELKITSHTCEEAIKAFEEALKLDAGYVLAMSNMAECQLLLGKPEEARGQLQQALALEPGNGRLMAQLSAVQLALEEPEAALKTAQAALALDKMNAEAYNVAGQVYMYYRGDLGNAIDAFSRAVVVAPRRWEGFVNLGLAFFQMESWYRARTEFRKALDLIPTATIANTAQQQAYLYYLIGRTYHQTKMYAQEVEALSEALSRAPSHLETMRQLALAYEAQRKFRAAEQVLNNALDVSPGPTDDAEIHVQMGTMFEHEGKPLEAVAAYSAAMKSDPNSLQAQQGLQRLQGGQ